MQSVPVQGEGAGSWLGKLALVIVILGVIVGVGYIALNQSGAIPSHPQSASPQQARSPVTSSPTTSSRSPAQTDAAPSSSRSTPSAASTSTPARTSTISTPPSVSAQREPGERKVITLPGTNVEMAFRWCPPGEFVMGSPANEAGRDASEGPQRTVRFARGFWLGETEVTQAQWRAVMPNNPSRFQGDDRPVERVSWNDTQEFIKQLRERGLQVRLPSEAEWEYASRAGTTTRFHFGNDESRLGEYAWYIANSSFRANSSWSTQPVGGKKPNAWGLSDMHGNVWEWCQDVWHHNYTGAPTDGSAWVVDGDESRRVLRGGGWGVDPLFCRSAFRLRLTAELRHSFLGFRLALDSD